MMELTVIQKIAIWALPVIFAITLHEAAHGYAAMRYGDKTAWMLGRVTLNPIKHIDLIGTVLVPLTILLMSKMFGGGFMLFGWAKPVPVNYANLRNPKRDMLWVAAAGPASNLFMALIWALVIKIGANSGGAFAQPMVLMGAAGIYINAILMALNLLPLPPLDGGRIAVSLLPRRYAYNLARVEPYGFYILLALMYLHLLGLFMWPLISMLLALAGVVTGISQVEFLSLIQYITR